MGYIDAHSHIWDQDFDRYPILPEYDPAAIRPITFTPQELFAHCQPCGVDRVVLIQMSYYGFDNSYMLDAIARWPETFRGVAVIDHSQAEVAEEMARLREGGVRGLRVQPGGAAPVDWLEDGEWRRFLGIAGELDMAVCPLIDPEYLPAVGRAAHAFPDTTFVIDHLGRVGCGRPMEQQDIASLCALGYCPNCNVKVSAFYALGKGDPPYDDLVPIIHQVYDAFGAARLMWATDCPYQVLHSSYEDSLALVRDGLDFLSDEDRALMLEGTAARVFFGI